MASRSEIEARRQLLAIARVGEAMAAAEWRAAAQRREEREDEERQAKHEALLAYDCWAASFGSPLVGPASIQAAANELVGRELGHGEAQERLNDAARLADERAGAARSAAARAEAGKGGYRMARARRAARIEERRGEELGDLMLARRMIGR